MPKSWITRGAETAERARRLMRLRGETPNGHPLWTGAEERRLTVGHPRYAAIMGKLPRRTRPAAYSKAGRLGIAKPSRPWDENEIPRLRKVYPTGTREQIMAAFPGRTAKAVAKAANTRGIYRKKCPLAASGIPIIDQILSRAESLGYSLKDLDALACSRGYFSRKVWRRRPDHAVHIRAAGALGGTVRAHFP